MFGFSTKLQKKTYIFKIHFHLALVSLSIVAEATFSLKGVERKNYEKNLVLAFKGSCRIE